MVRWYEPTLGNCFTFNHEDTKPDFKMRNSGEENGTEQPYRVVIPSWSPSGFQAYMRVRQDEYLFWVDNAALSIFVHPMGQLVFSDSLRFLAEPGSKSTLLISKVR